MSELTFNGKLKLRALQIGKANEPGESSPQPSQVQPPAPPGRPGCACGHPESRETSSSACFPLHAKLIFPTKPKRIFKYCL